jgi:hypothetical protein
MIVLTYGVRSMNKVGYDRWVKELCFTFSHYDPLIDYNTKNVDLVMAWIGCMSVRCGDNINASIEPI